MNIFKTLRNGAHDNAPDGDSPELGAADATLTERYEGLKEREAVAELGQLNQVELTAIDTFERANGDRPAVLNKLRYLRQAEPLPDYDALEQSAITEALSTADADTIKAVREYEQKLQHRPTVLKEVSSALRRLREQSPPVPEQPLVVGNGLPIKVKPESGLDL